MTSFGIGKSVIQTDCHVNRSFLVQEGPFWDQKLSYKANVILSGSTVESPKTDFTVARSTKSVPGGHDVDALHEDKDEAHDDHDDAEPRDHGHDKDHSRHETERGEN